MAAALCVAGSVSAAGAVSANERAADVSDGGPAVVAGTDALDYSQKSDYQLTELGARWDDLSRAERDALLREVKLRMAKRNDSDGVLVIRTQRRYGRVYHSEGRYLKIETKVVRVRPADPSGRPPEGGFGTGFEQRTAVTSEPETGEPSTDALGERDRGPTPPPAVRVRDTSG